MNLRILTWNMWHGLNPYQHIFMLPMESILDRYWRRRRQLEFLNKWAGSSLDILCLQEVNPLSHRLEKLKDVLGLEGSGCKVNTGIKIQNIGLPPFLEEGLATLVGNDFSDSTFDELTLSGTAHELRGPLGMRLDLQLKERRKALIFQGEHEGKRVMVVNLHLHHGPDTVVENLSRKTSELWRLYQWVESKMDQLDVLIVCGDFNCEDNSPCLEPIRRLGLKDCSHWDSEFKMRPTWDPSINSLTRKSSEFAESPESKEWDLSPHVFDRIYLKSKIPIKKVMMNQFSDLGLSDHFAVAAEIQL